MGDEWLRRLVYTKADAGSVPLCGTEERGGVARSDKNERKDEKIGGIFRFADPEAGSVKTLKGFPNLACPLLKCPTVPRR